MYDRSWLTVPHKSSNPVASCFHNQRRDLSLRNSRGDWTRLELFLASVRRWETGLRRIFVWETDGKRP
jgi:hypothetical protein